MDKSELLSEEQRAIQLDESGNEVSALEIWLLLASEMPKARFYCRAGTTLKNLHRYSEAESAFRSALSLDPNVAPAALGLAIVLIKERKPSDAVVTLDAVIAKESSALAYELRGVALMDMGRDQEALQSFHEAIELDPSYEEAFFNIGGLLKSTDEMEARSAFSKAIALDADYAPAHRELGWLLRKANDFDGAERHLRRATELDTSDSWAWIYLGNLLWAKSEFSSAEDAFKQAYDHAPNEWYPNWALASFYENGEKFEEAARLYHRALSASPDESVVLFDFGRFLLKQGDREAAIKHLERAVRFDSTHEAARRLLGEISGHKAV